MAVTPYGGRVTEAYHLAEKAKLNNYWAGLFVYIFTAETKSETLTELFTAWKVSDKRNSNWRVLVEAIRPPYKRGIKPTSPERILELVSEKSGKVPETRQELETAKTELIARLDRGCEVIRRKWDAGETPETLEDKFIEMLDTYKWVCDQLDHITAKELQERLSA